MKELTHAGSAFLRIAAVCLTLVACSRTQTTSGSHTFEGSTSQISTPPTSEMAHLAAVSVAHQEGRDRVVLEFTDHVPGYTISYQPLPAHQDGSGAEIPLPDAKAAVRVDLMRATGSGWSAGVPTYFGPSTVRGDTAVVTEAKAAGDFEAVLSWVVGVRSVVPFSAAVLAQPPRLVVDFGPATESTQP